jgi:hypothetical protein
MNKRLHELIRLFWTALLLGASSGIAQAQDLDDEDVAQPVQARPAFVVADQTFDQWVFGNVRNVTGTRLRFESYVKLRIDEIDRACHLTDDQKKKLALAGRGDLKRLFDRVEDKRRKFQLVKTDQAALNNLFQELQPLRMSLNSAPQEPGSIFSKTIAKTLNETQLAAYDTAVHAKEQFLFGAKIDLVVASLDTALGLSDAQRRRLAKLMLDELDPPKKFGPYDYQVLIYELSHLCEDKLKPIFDDTQWRALQAHFNRYRGLEAFLKNNGYIANDKAPAPAGGIRRKEAAGTRD